ncbi:MAG: glutamate-1-semialdehyde 2,1-aminomutase [Chloroflexota bacterium]|jgi:glutamate-1-semialdehyde 2,1-aminomutase|nr:glutamate-1-semialdehyde 2,1-aminomutase [Chloroflexota bacterium]MDP6758566.1 glutamate-1-semialdehyde 2,1-aminomutase [Chloroflexota bacterium]
MDTSRSEELFAAACRVIPGGVNSPARAFGSVSGTPRFVKRAEGAYFWDVDGNRYLDFVLSWGPLAAGHAHPAVVQAVGEAAARGTSYGAPTAAETELAQMIVDALPAVEMVRLVNSGTEATMSAVRLARAFTGRAKIVKFAGCYHGHADGFLVQAGSGVATLGLPDSPGVTAGTTADTLAAPFNDLAAVEELFAEQGADIAAVIVEPVAGNMGVVLPVVGFLDGLQELCRDNGALLILDEVITGFRASPGGVQGRWDLQPDITCLGKVIGGGLPVGAYGGRHDVMETVAPVGAMYQAGTLSGNPLATNAGLATLKVLGEAGGFDRAEALAGRLAAGLGAAAIAARIRVQTAHVGTMLGMFFIKDGAPDDAAISNYVTATEFADTERYGRYFHALLERGVYFAPSQFEAAFTSTAHTEEDIDMAVVAAGEVMAGLRD